jgi:dinuclear metal center YbgI/SA1388 family protein
MFKLKLYSFKSTVKINFLLNKINLNKFSIQQKNLTMDLKQVVNRLKEYANPKYAGDWDNVGLLIEPTESLIVKKILVTNDLTEPVLDEAIKKNINLIVSYHPAIFNPLKRLTQSNWKERTIIKCIENRIAVYSPHTSWDSIEGGINDWILEPFSNLFK